MNNQPISSYNMGKSKDFCVSVQYSLNYLKNQEKVVLLEINKPNKEIKLWREDNKIFFQLENTDKIFSGSKAKIEQEINSRYDITIHFVSDLNDVLRKKSLKKMSETIFIAVSSLPVVESTIFDIKNKKKFIKQKDETYLRNLFVNSPYLFHKISAPFYSDNWIITLLSKLVESNHLKSLQLTLGSFYHDLRASKALVLVGDKRITNELFIDNIVIPIFNKHNYICLNSKTLDSLKDYKIIDKKLIYHIDKIPKNRRKRQRLYELVKSILCDKSCYGKIIFTIEKENLFLKDFIGSIDTFFINPLEKILENLKEKDIVGLIRNINKNLNYFAKYLSTLSKTETIDNDNDKLLEVINNFNNKKTNTSNYIYTSSIITLNPFDKSIDTAIPLDTRHKHMIITGQTGSGKSELAKSLIYNDIKRNDGVIVLLEPHGDLAEQVAKLPIEKERLVYIDLTLDDNMTPSINLFYLINKSEKEIQARAKVIVSVVKSVNDTEKFTGVMEDVLYNVLCVLLRAGKSDFFDVLTYLSAKSKGLLQLGKKSPNILEKEFFTNDFENIKSTRNAVKRRIKKLLNDPLLANLFNGTSTIDLEQLLNKKGKIIIFRIQKSEMLDSYAYYARFIIGLIQTIALKRARINEEDRVPTYCYIDEFHNFITSTIEEILTESRKYALYMTLINQSVSQIKNSALRDIILSNTNVKLIGKNSNKTLDAMNNTLNTKLEDVESLNTGEFYLSIGTGEVVKIKNSDVLLSDNANISSSEWSKLKAYQLEHYYRSIESDNLTLSGNKLNQKIDEFINAIKLKKIDYFDNVKNNESLYNELIHNFRDESNGAQGYISKQDLYLYFNLVYSNSYFEKNIKLLRILRRDEFFEQNVNVNKTYNGKKRLMIK